MKEKMKKNLSLFLLVLSLIIAPLQYASAQGNPPLSPAWQDVIDDYELKRVDDVPAGVIPLQFDTPDKLQSFLAKIKYQAQNQTHITYIEKGILIPTSPTAVTYTVITRSCSANVGFANFNTWGDIRVGRNGSYRWIDKVLSTRTGLTGITTGFTLVNDYSYSYNQTAYAVSVKGGGIVNVYLVIEGGLLVYSQPVSCSFTYRVY